MSTAIATKDKPIHGIRREDLKPCGICGKGLAHDRHPMAYRVEVTSYIVDQSAVQQQAGLEMMLGDPFLAHFMGTDPEFYKGFTKSDVLLCSSCYLRTYVAQIPEAAVKQQSDEAGE